MTAIVDIYNMAVMEAGHSQAITDPNESTNAANLCRTFYPSCRDMVLEAVDWNFATKRVVLSLLTNTQTNWEYAYAYPADAVRVRALVLEGKRAPGQAAVPFEVAQMDGQRVILTDLPEAEMIYTARVENPNLFSPTFTTALTYLLASRVAVPLTGKPDMAAQARQGYLLTLASAAAHSLNEVQRDQMPDDEFTEARHA